MITTHILDTSEGKPAMMVTLHLEFQDGSSWKRLSTGATDTDGRCATLMQNVAPQAGVYRLIFETGNYFKIKQRQTFYPRITVLFEIKDIHQHYHVPLLLNPYGYSTYRGS